MKLRRHGFQLIVLGSGESRLEQIFTDLQRAFPRQVCFYRGFLEPLAHFIEAGADMFLMPSRYEPCGLTQLYAMRYGTAPIVRRTGGLADTVVDIDEDPASGTGVLFDPPTVLAFADAIERAVVTWTDKARWRALQRRGMEQEFGWERGAAAYRAVYRSARPEVP